MTDIKMKGPKGCEGQQAVIEGHTYDVPKTGIIKVVSENHLDTLRAHGFVEHYEDPADVALWIEEQEDKDELVEFIEERGGKADNDMGLKKLKRLAREAAGISE